MKTTSSNVNLADYYYGFLKKLSKESKIDLIERLVQSLKEDSPDSEHDEIISLESFFETFASDVTAADILSEIKALKKFKSEGPSNLAAGTF
ncbi:MAG: hypothetical protein ABIN48_12650 [Ginsengibacter sp.]